MKIDLIYGGFGQDGQLTSQLLTKAGHPHVLIGRGRHRCHLFGEIQSDCLFATTCLDRHVDTDTIKPIVSRGLIRDIYFFAAFNPSSEARQSDANNAIQSFFVNYHLFNKVVSAVEHSPKVRAIFYANSCKIFEGRVDHVVDEQTDSKPITAYGYSKAFVRELVAQKVSTAPFKLYNGIFFHHESELRKPDFFSAKVIRQAIEVKRGDRAHIEINSLEGSFDVGLANDYCEAVMRLVESGAPSGDYIIGSGSALSLREFVDLVLRALDIPNFPVKEIEKPSTRPAHACCVGRSEKLKSAVGLKVRRPEELVRILVEKHLIHRSKLAATL